MNFLTEELKQKIKADWLKNNLRQDNENIRDYLRRASSNIDNLHTQEQKKIDKKNYSKFVKAKGWI